MRTVAAVLCFLALPAVAQAHTKRLTVDGVRKWETPETYGRNAPVEVQTCVNGEWAQKGNYIGKRGFVTRKNGVLIEARGTPGKGPVLFRIANFRTRDARVRIVYHLAAG
jgi:hypothetical protein